MILQKRHYYKIGEVITAYFTTDKNYIKQGLYESYYSNGQLEIRCTYKNGQKDGPYEEYLEDGRLLDSYAYKKGKPLFEKRAADYIEQWKKENDFPKLQQHFNALIQREKQRSRSSFRSLIKKALRLVRKNPVKTRE